MIDTCKTPGRMGRFSFLYDLQTNSFHHTACSTRLFKAMVPDDLLMQFFEEATKALGHVASGDRPPTQLSLSNCRGHVLEIQRSVLRQTVQDYNRHHASFITGDEAQACLAGLSHMIADSSLGKARTKMEEAARFALCRLVLYTETNWSNEVHRELQTEGSLERSKLLDFIALCHTAIKLPSVQKYLADGTPLFERDHVPCFQTHAAEVEEEPTAMKFPQMRLERIQRYIAKAIGWAPEFTTKELRRLFFVQGESSEFANDTEVINRFHQLILDMSAAISTASLQASTSELSDLAEGGVTRVVSVKCSDVAVERIADDDERSPFLVSAPTRMTIDPILSDEEQKRQLRIASEATRLQQEIVEELKNMTEEQRKQELAEAKRAAEEFLKTTMTLPPGSERISYLQSIDPQTSRLLAIHKLWPTVQTNTRN